MAGVNGYILGRPKYRVTAPVVVIVSVSGGETYVNRDAMVPLDALPSQVEHLVRAGLIEEVAA